MQKRQSGAGWLRRGVLIVIPIALLGELGHHLLEQLGRSFAHHLFHIGFGGAALLLFVLLIAADVRRNGWPTFSWRLHSPSAQLTRDAPPKRGA